METPHEQNGCCAVEAENKGSGPRPPPGTGVSAPPSPRRPGCWYRHGRSRAGSSRAPSAQRPRWPRRAPLLRGHAIPLHELQQKPRSGHEDPLWGRHPNRPEPAGIPGRRRGSDKGQGTSGPCPQRRAYCGRGPLGRRSRSPLLRGHAQPGEKQRQCGHRRCRSRPGHHGSQAQGRRTAGERGPLQARL